MVLDRLVLRPDAQTRLAGSLEQAFQEGGGRAVVEILREGGPPDVRRYGEQFGCHACGIPLERPQPLLFSFNHPLGACPECKGFGNLLRYDEARVIPDPSTSLAAGAVEPWRHPSGEWYQKELLKVARRRKIDIHRPYAELPEAARHWVYEGDKDFCGIRGFFEEVEGYRYKLHVRVFLSRYRSQVRAPPATALASPEALAVTVAGKRGGVAHLAIDDLAAWLEAPADRVGGRSRAGRAGPPRHVVPSPRGLTPPSSGRCERFRAAGAADRSDAARRSWWARSTSSTSRRSAPRAGVARLPELCRELAHAGNTVVVVEHTAPSSRAPTTAWSSG